MPTISAPTAARRWVVPSGQGNAVRRAYDLLRSSLHDSGHSGSTLIEEELVDALSASRTTVRAALQLLADEGVVRGDPRCAATPLESTKLPLNKLLTPDDKASTYQISRRSLGAAVIEAPAIVSRWLRLPPAAHVALLEALVLRDDTPVGVTASYVTLPQEEVLLADQHDVIGFLVNRLRVRVGQAESTVAAVAADAETARLLGIAEGAPMLWLEDYVRDVDGVPCAVTQLRYRGDCVAFSALLAGRLRAP